MNIDEYIEFYECCHRALKKLRADTQITKIDCENISKKYANNIFQEMIDTGAGLPNGLFIQKHHAVEMVDGLYYEKKILKLKLEKKEDERKERIVACQEKTKNFAILSAIAASISALAAIFL